MKNFKNVFILLGLVLLGVGFYFNFSNRQSKEANNVVEALSKIDKVLAKDIATAKTTPKDAVKYYSEILECLYNEEPTEKEIEKLGLKAREVLDEELNENNPIENYLADLNIDVLEYQKVNRVILSYTVDLNNDIEYQIQEEKEYAIVNATYTFRAAEIFTKTNQEYILRKDEEGYWKILGWRIASQNALDNQNNNEERK